MVLPAGYRFVKVGEYLRTGDLYPCRFGHWQRLGTCGYTGGVRAGRKCRHENEFIRVEET